MCKTCDERARAAREKREEAAVLDNRLRRVKSDLLKLLSIDKLKGSDYIRLKEMITSQDRENLTVVEEVIKNL